VAAGTPFVLAMQDDISQVPARSFAGTFYRALLTDAAGHPDVAANAARSTLLDAGLGGAFIPVLFMRAAESVPEDPAERQRREYIARRWEEIRAQAAQRVFIPRPAEMQALEAALLGATGLPVAVTAVQGMPGVGKSYLAQEFVFRHAAAFPGGSEMLALAPGDTRTAEDLCRELCDRMHLQLEGMTTWQALAQRLRAPRTLLLVENADDPLRGNAAATLASGLPGCPVLVTARWLDLGRGGRWARVEVKPFEEADALAQLAPSGARLPATPRHRRLVRELGRLRAIHLAAAYLNRPGQSVDATWTPAGAADARWTLAAGGTGARAGCWRPPSTCRWMRCVMFGDDGGRCWRPCAPGLCRLRRPEPGRHGRAGCSRFERLAVERCSRWRNGRSRPSATPAVRLHPCWPSCSRPAPRDAARNV
jgi:hypothetical protein